VAYSHEREAEQVQPGPVLGGGGVLVIRGQADASDPVGRRCLNQDSATGAEQEVPQFGVLAELGQVPAHD
jgi:hypothetical protein